MTRKNYSVDEVLNQLRRNPDVKVKGLTVRCYTADHPHYQGQIGNGTRGKLAFLEKNGYDIIWISQEDPYDDVFEEPIKQPVKQIVERKRKIKVVKAGKFSEMDHSGYMLDDPMI